MNDELKRLLSIKESIRTEVCKKLIIKLLKQIENEISKFDIKSDDNFNKDYVLKTIKNIEL